MAEERSDEGPCSGVLTPAVRVELLRKGVRTPAPGWVPAGFYPDFGRPFRRTSLYARSRTQTAITSTTKRTSSTTRKQPFQLSGLPELRVYVTRVTYRDQPLPPQFPLQLVQILGPQVRCRSY